MHALISLVVAAQPASSDLLLKAGDAAPPFAMRDLGRALFSIRDHTGGDAKEPRKAIVMVFFATWCEPCKKEVPIIRDIHGRWAARGVEVIYLGLSEGAKELAPFAEKHKFPWRVIPDAFGLLARRYGVSQLPHLFIIDKDGNVGFQHRGIAPDLAKVIEEQLGRITGEKPDRQGALDIVKPRFNTTYRLGRAPSGPTSSARWAPLAAFLGEAVGANIETATEASYEAFEQALSKDQYDLANAGPLLCYDVRDSYEAVARIERQGSPTYFGIVFTQRASPVRSLADLKGRSLGLVSSRSSSGGLYPLMALVDAGLVPDKDLKIVWLGSHAKVAEAVKAGAVDAGGCYEDCRDAVWTTDPAKAAATRVLTYTREIPSEMIVVRRSLEPVAKQKLVKAVLSLNDAPGILAQISQGETTVTAVVPASPADLAGLTDAIRRVSVARAP